MTISKKVVPKISQSKLTIDSIIILVVFILVIVVPLFIFFVPVETIHIGNCGTKTQRLSLIRDNTQILEARKEAAKRAVDEQRIRASGFDGLRGCSGGPQYAVYVF